jgi:hypothetical protein
VPRSVTADRGIGVDDEDDAATPMSTARALDADFHASRPSFRCRADQVAQRVADELITDGSAEAPGAIHSTHARRRRRE